MDKVYQSNTDCCGCGICMTVCPKHAISMRDDEKGFVYPVINRVACIDCGACRRICSFSKRKTNHTGEEILKCYAACNRNREELSHSTSGGIFSAVAHSLLEQGGIVAGVCMDLEYNGVHVYHTLIDSKERLPELQGSKYVQSNLWECLKSMENLLRAGRTILFSGTPCQVDAVKGKFRKYIRTQLFTIDIICHGVPSQKFLEDFLNEYQKGRKLSLKKLIFRDKKYGWGLSGQLISDNNKSEKFTKNDFSYYKYFLDGETYRDSCYCCPYACPKRVGDITIGDYWGIKDYDPQLLVENGGAFDTKEGISCLIVNNKRGKELLKNFGYNIQKEPVEIQHIMQINKQLREPAKYTKMRKKIFLLYTKKGYSAVEKMFKIQWRLKKIKSRVKGVVKG
mgnify:CR=1 FL=1